MILLWFMKRGARKLKLPAEELQWWEEKVRVELRRKRLTDALFASGMAFGPSLYAFFQRSERQVHPSDIPWGLGLFLMMYGLRRVMSASELEAAAKEHLAAHRLRQELLLPEPAPASAARSLDGDHVA